MTLIGILLALLAERLMGHLPRVGEPLLLERLIVGVQSAVPLPRYWPTAVAPLVFLIVTTGAAGAFSWWLQQPLLDLAFEVVVLFLCIGPRNLSGEIHKLMEARANGDEAAEKSLTLALLRGPARRTSRRSLIGALFIRSHERVFGVLLWFFVAGPAGAILYRVASRMPRFYHESLPGSDAERMAVNLHAIAAWVPSKITAFLFGLAGSLDATIRHWRTMYSEHVMHWRDRTWAVLSDVSAATLLESSEETGELLPATLEACLTEVLAVQTRALIILLAAFGLFTTGGWFT